MNTLLIILIGVDRYVSYVSYTISIILLHSVMHQCVTTSERQAVMPAVLTIKHISLLWY